MQSHIQQKIDDLRLDHGDKVTIRDIGDFVQYTLQQLCSPSDRAQISSDESNQQLNNHVEIALDFAFKLDAIEVAPQIMLSSEYLSSLNIQELKASQKFEDLYSLRKSSINISRLLSSVINAIEFEKTSISAKNLIEEKMVSNRNYSFFTDFVVLDKSDSYVIVVPTCPGLNRTNHALLECDAKMIAYEIDSLQIDSSKPVDIIQAEIKEPMISSLIPTLTLPDNFSLAQALMTGQIISKNFNPQINYKPVTQFTVSAIEGLMTTKDAQSVPNKQSIKQLNDVYSTVGDKHVKLLESFRDEVHPLYAQITDHLPYGYEELCALLQNTHNALLEDIFDRSRVIGELVNTFEHPYQDVATLPVSTLLSRVVREASELGSVLNVRRYLKNQHTLNFDKD